MICNFKIKKKLTQSSMFWGTRYVYGIVLLNDKGHEIASPVYPFVFKEDKIANLEKFVSEHLDLLVACHQEEKPRKFSEYVCGGWNTQSKYFSDRWYYRGVYTD